MKEKIKRTRSAQVRLSQEEYDFLEQKANMSLLFKYVKNEVIELGKKTTVDEIDAEGMGEFFADTENMNTDNENKNEAVSSATSSIEINITKPNKEMMGYEESLSADTEYPVDDSYDPEDYEEDYGNSGSKDQHDDGHNRTHDGTGFGGGEGDNPGTHRSFTAFSTSTDFSGIGAK